MGILEQRFEELLGLIPDFQSHSKSMIEAAAVTISDAFMKGNKVLICGNGGSAADSQHFAAEFVNVFSRELNRKALPAIALSTDTSVITSIANDFSFVNIFSRQVEAYGNEGDILITFTTSGSSANCMKAIATAKTQNLISIAFTKYNSEIAGLADITVEVPSNNTQHIQECHMLAYHVIVELVENKLFGGPSL